MSEFSLLIILCFAQTTTDTTSPPTETIVYCGSSELQLWQRIIGDISSWISGILYFVGRFPQIIHIYRTKDVEGVSIFLFLMATIANLFYSTSIFMSGIDVTSIEFYESTLAYIVGSLCVVPFSLVIIYQVLYYKHIKAWWYTRKLNKKANQSTTTELITEIATE